MSAHPCLLVAKELGDTVGLLPHQLVDLRDAVLAERLDVAATEALLPVAEGLGDAVHQCLLGVHLLVGAGLGFGDLHALKLLGLAGFCNTETTPDRWLTQPKRRSIRITETDQTWRRSYDPCDTETPCRREDHSGPTEDRRDASPDSPRARPRPAGPARGDRSRAGKRDPPVRPLVPAAARREAA